MKSSVNYILLLFAQIISAIYANNDHIPIKTAAIDDKGPFPQFPYPEYWTTIQLDQKKDSDIIEVMAKSYSNRTIRYTLRAQGKGAGTFNIGPITGIVKLAKELQEKKTYVFIVTATEEGTNFWASVRLTIKVIGVNLNKPIIEGCGSYHLFAPQVKEGAPNGTHIITIKATDQDKGLNGQVRYFLLQQPDQKGSSFLIDEMTGEIQTNKIFDKKEMEDSFVRVTVKAVDRGMPPLEGIVCTFNVEIIDNNDNPPVFDRNQYEENVKQDTPIGANIVQVKALDMHSSKYGQVIYSLPVLKKSSDVDYFTINPESGWITLKKTLDKERYLFVAIASDQGTPQHKTAVKILINTVDATNRSPIWEQSYYGPIVIRENIDVGRKVVSIKARSGIPDNPTVFYSLLRGPTEPTNKLDSFYLSQRFDGDSWWADIFVNYPLDYEKVKEYNLTVRVENNGVQQLASETTVNIVLEDVNDRIPFFLEQENPTILRGSPIGTRVTQIQAIDKDGTYPNNKVHYSIESKNNIDPLFSVDYETGEIFTRTEFDKDNQQVYRILVRAKDGLPSELPNMNDTVHNSVTKYINIEYRM